MRMLILVGFGSFLGGISRYLTSQIIQTRFISAFPYGTLAVNIIGCLLIGLIIGWNEKFSLSSEWRLFLATGLCGGFTTFSAFSAETLLLMRSGQFVYAITYISVSVLSGIVATFIGASIFK